MWHIVTFCPVSMVSLKIATATSTGGKSLLLPTPYAIKMALLNVAIQDSGVETAQTIWNNLRDAEIAMRGPDWITVNHTFTKILKPLKNGPSADSDTGLTRPMGKSIGFREYVHWQGELSIAMQAQGTHPDQMLRWLTMVNYLGKRGGFIQSTGEHQQTESLDADFVSLSQAPQGFHLDGTLQIMDDCDHDTTFEQVNIYSDKKLSRVFRHVVIPYKLKSSSRGYSLYQRLK